MIGNAQGRSLELFFIDGKPDGMLTAEVFNGRPTNGTIEWKVKGTAKTYKDWEAEKLTREQGGKG